MAVEIKAGENIEKALKKAKTDWQRKDVIGEVRKRESYMGPSKKRQEKSKKARRKKSKKGGNNGGWKS